MKKVIRLTESDLMRIVKRVMNESKKFGSFDDEVWYDEYDKFTRVDDMGDDFDDEEFDDFDSFSSKHGHDTKWFGKGDSGRKMFDTYKDKHSKPFKVRTRRGMDEQKGLVTGAKGAGTIKTGSSFGYNAKDFAKDFAMGALGGLPALFSPEESWKKLVSTYSPLFGVLNTDTGKNLVKVLVNGTSAGIIKNMALAASKGDANSFTQAWAQAQKQTKTDLTQLKNAAFKDMKSFGKLLQQSGINEQSITGNNNGLYVSAGPARTAKVKKSPEGANNPEWINLVSKLKTLTYQPKILSFTSYGADHPSQSLNWGLAKSRNGKYTLVILTTDKKLPNPHMSLYNQKDRNEEKQMLNWWNNKGYKTDYNYVYFDFAQANKLKFDLESFFKAYPPE